MPAPTPRSKFLKLLLLALLLAVAAGAVYYSVSQNRPWIVPEEAKKRVNPVPLTPGGLQTARGLFLDHCAECHGNSGRGDGPDAKLYDPPPRNLLDALHMNSVTDGELFYRISEGHKPMPAFKKRMTEQQRWQLVLLLRAMVAAAPQGKPSAPSR